MKKATTLKGGLDAVKALLQGIRCEEKSETALLVASQVLEKEGVLDLDAKELLVMNLIEVFFSMESQLDQETCRKNLFIWDWVFLKHLIDLGEKGREFAEIITPRLEDNYSSYCNDKRSSRLLKNWEFQEGLSPVFLILTEALWLDQTKSSWARKKKTFLPCLKEYGSPLLSLF